MLGSRAGPSSRPPTREKPPNFGAKIDIYIYIYIYFFFFLRYWKNIVLRVWFTSSTFLTGGALLF